MSEAINNNIYSRISQNLKKNQNQLASLILKYLLYLDIDWKKDL